MKNYCWKNQYIDLCTTKPSFIVPAENHTLLDGQAEFLNQRINQFESIFRNRIWIRYSFSLPCG